MPNPTEFEEQLSHLTNEQYDALVKERIARLNPEQQVIANAREVKRQERFKLINKAFGPGGTEEDHEHLYNVLRDGTDACEHGRSICKHCIACGEMDHIMWPELYDDDGFRFQDDE